MFLTDFRRLLLFGTLGLLIVFCTLMFDATVSSQENRPNRTNLENIPYYPYQSENRSEASNRANDVLITSASKVTFQSLRNGEWNIYVGNDDGTGQTAVTTSNGTNVYPHLKRGSNIIVYASRASGNDFEIYKINVDGNNRVPLTTNDADDVRPQWSPDGSKILFESYRNGQAEIYVMNADGSNQTRLTTHLAFDGMPSWSPDGNKIAFSSNRSGGYRIWVMNADGSNLIQLSTQPYSLRPKWSPDGSKIAYDADNDGDSWQDLWVMNADGSEQDRVFFESDSNTDYWVSSWSPDSRYLAFTRIHFVYYQGNWYWDHAYQEARNINWPANNLTKIPMSQSDVDWYPGWQTTDAQRPVSYVNTLGTQSPAHIHLNWAGTDTGGSGGVARYDVQVKNGINGPWIDWLTGTTATSGQYLGNGSHTYYFRVRAYDLHYNIENWPSTHDAVTTVESLAPLSYLTTLMPYSRQDNIPLITWSGHDPGGSGIASYDVQYRVNNGSWDNWLTNATVEGSNFTMSSHNLGDTLHFRTRARDYAQNQAGWPAAEDVASTTLYNWGVQGIAYDNTSTPVSELSVDTDPAAIGVIAEDINGRYSAYVAIDVPSYQANWYKNGYNPLPNTTFTSGLNTNQTVWLPPSNNIVANWDFEEGIGQSAWELSGTNTPLIANSAKHTGDFGILLGSQPIDFDPKETVSQGYYPQMVVDAENTVHLTWIEGAQMNYKNKPAGGNWSQTQILHDNIWAWPFYKLAIDDYGDLHIVIWDHEFDIYYFHRDYSSGQWSNANVSQDDYWSRYPSLAVEENGEVHIVWQSQNPGSNSSFIFYAHQLENGTFSTPLLLEDSFGYSKAPQIIIDGSNKIHISWYSKNAFNDAKFLYVSNVHGDWPHSQEINEVLDVSFFTRFVVADDGTVHFLWQEYSNSVTTTFYRYINAQGVWADIQTLSELSESINNPQVAVDPVGTLHMVWLADDSIHYMQKGKYTDWMPVEILAPSSAYPQIKIDQMGEVHIFWGGGPYFDSPSSDVYHMQQLNNGTWTIPLNLSQGDNDPEVPTLAMDASGGVHIAWSDLLNPQQHRDIRYRGPQQSETSKESIITQQLTLPMTMTAPTLSVVYQLVGAHSQSDSYLSIMVDGGGIQEEVVTIHDSSSGWQHTWADLTPWLGQTINVTLTLYQAANAPMAWVYVDEISIGSTYPDVWVDIDDGNAALEQEVTQTISYGNRGGTTANGIVVTYTLPAELTFVSASISPDSTDPLVWHLSDLPAKSDPHTIVLTTQVNTTASAFTYLTSTAVITIEDAELELLNNEAEGHIYTADYVYLPVILR